MTRLAPFVALAFAGCNCGVPDPRAVLFACDASADCASGFVCAVGACYAADASCIPTAAAEICNDGVDNDCNGLIDCADPACLHQGCTPGTLMRTSVCCFQGPNSTACIPLTRDAQNCGGCGLACGAGQGCNGGKCSCQGSCPNGQSCNAGQCNCTAGIQCAAGQQCTTDQTCAYR